MAKTMQIDASPTKQFFVRMLTRDIDLLEAILDLLDNCVDGIIRTIKTRKDIDSARPYKGFFAHITANKNKFVIEDNCGGIPRAVAEKVAFRLGRPTDEELKALAVNIEKLETVGLYGIGMKRAIFKMGREAVVTSEHGNHAFRVEITPAWLDSPTDWFLDLSDTRPGGTPGTRIEVSKLHPEVANEFSPDRNFLGNLRNAIEQLFAVIIAKGFVVDLNHEVIKPVLVKLLVSADNKVARVNPYVLRGRMKAVGVEIVVGFQRDPSSLSEADNDEDTKQAAVRQAGWTVICNDRLVLFGDKSEMTGWGTRPVPRFHPQFNAIAGSVTLKSDNLDVLPLNTKKRGIDASVGVYPKVLDFMKDGVKLFTEFTNNWKENWPEIVSYFRTAKPVPAAEVADRIPSKKYSRIPPARLADDSAEVEEFTPELPLPPGDPATRIVRFSKPVLEIREIGGAILGDEGARPKDVGEACFDQVLRNIRKAKKKS
jgi:hypothetical protein